MRSLTPTCCRRCRRWMSRRSINALFLHGSANRVSSEAVQPRPIPRNTATCFWRPARRSITGGRLQSGSRKRKAKGGWKPKNRKVHIVQEQIAYTPDHLEMRAGSASSGKVSSRSPASPTSNIPVQDWATVIRELKEVDAGMIMIDHWLASELAAFAKALCGRSGAKCAGLSAIRSIAAGVLTLTGAAGNGFCWSTVTGVYADERGLAFERNTGTVPGRDGPRLHGDRVRHSLMLKRAWEAVGDPAQIQLRSIAGCTRQSLSGRVRLLRHEQSRIRRRCISRPRV